MVGVDGSAAAQRALAWAVREASCRDGVVHAVHIWSSPRRRTPGPPAYPHEERDAAEALLLAAIESTPGRRGVSLSSQAISGEVVPSLLRASAGADVLVLGHDGDQPMSVYRRCAQDAPCPVTVVRPTRVSRPRPARRGSASGDWLLASA